MTFLKSESLSIIRVDLAAIESNLSLPYYYQFEFVIDTPYLIFLGQLTSTATLLLNCSGYPGDPLSSGRSLRLHRHVSDNSIFPQRSLFLATSFKGKSTFNSLYHLFLQ
jgi:hypothetical protein